MPTESPSPVYFMKDTANIAELFRTTTTRERNMMTLLLWLETVRDELEMRENDPRNLDDAQISELMKERCFAWDVIEQIQTEIAASFGDAPDGPRRGREAPGDPQPPGDETSRRDRTVGRHRPI